MTTRVRMGVLAAATALAIVTPALAQEQAPPAAPPAAPTAAPAAPRRSAPATVRPTTMTVAVTDASGAPLPGVSVSVTGPVTRNGSSGDTGTLKLAGIRAGTYRLRFEKRGFIVLEREVVVARGTPVDIEVTLNPATEPEPEPEPETAEPEKRPAPTAADAPPGEPASMVIADFVERNFIKGREPRREDQVGCTASARTTLLQIREPSPEEARADADEVLYVVAGEGTLRLGNRDVALESSTVAIVPRGTARALTRRGRNPLIVLSVVSGPACTAAKRE